MCVCVPGSASITGPAQDLICGGRGPAVEVGPGWDQTSIATAGPPHMDRHVKVVIAPSPWNTKSAGFKKHVYSRFDENGVEKHEDDIWNHCCDGQVALEHHLEVSEILWIEVVVKIMTKRRIVLVAKFVHEVLKPKRNILTLQF